jgi:hypothetical protein
VRLAPLQAHPQALQRHQQPGLQIAQSLDGAPVDAQIHFCHP